MMRIISNLLCTLCICFTGISNASTLWTGGVSDLATDTATFNITSINPITGLLDTSVATVTSSVTDPFLGSTLGGSKLVYGERPMIISVTFSKPLVDVEIAVASLLDAQIVTTSPFETIAGPGVNINGFDVDDQGGLDLDIGDLNGTQVAAASGIQGTQFIAPGRITDSTTQGGIAAYILGVGSTPGRSGTGPVTGGAITSLTFAISGTVAPGNNSVIQIAGTVVPEPSRAMMAGLASIALLLRRRRS